MSLFDKPLLPKAVAKAQKKDFAEFKKEEKRKAQIEKLKKRTEVNIAKKQLAKSQERLAKRKSGYGILGLKKKKMTKTLSRKSRIRLI